MIIDYMSTKDVQSFGCKEQAWQGDKFINEEHAWLIGGFGVLGAGIYTNFIDANIIHWKKGL